MWAGGWTTTTKVVPAGMDLSIWHHAGVSLEYDGPTRTTTVSAVLNGVA